MIDELLSAAQAYADVFASLFVIATGLGIVRFMLRTVKGGVR